MKASGVGERGQVKKLARKEGAQELFLDGPGISKKSKDGKGGRKN